MVSDTRVNQSESQPRPKLEDVRAEKYVSSRNTPREWICQHRGTSNRPVNKGQMQHLARDVKHVHAYLETRGLTQFGDLGDLEVESTTVGSSENIAPDISWSAL